MRIRRGISWSVPRWRGRGEQGEIVRQTQFVPALYTVLRRAAATQPFARKSQTNHRPVARLSFAYHGLASEARSTLGRTSYLPGCRQPDLERAALAFLAGHSK